MENKKCAIFNFWNSGNYGAVMTAFALCEILKIWNSGNYGAVMTAFALCEILKKMGLSPYLINYDNKQYARFFKIKRPLELSNRDSTASFGLLLNLVIKYK